MTTETKKERLNKWQRNNLMDYDNTAVWTGKRETINEVRAQRDSAQIAFSKLAQAHDLVLAQRNELLIWLRDLVEQVEHYADADDCDLPDTSDARRAIAKVEA